MMTSAWWRDFQFDGATVQVRKTGARIRVEPGVIAETLSWMVFHGRIELERLSIRADGPRIWFAPDTPRPWYLIWPVAQLAGLRLTTSPETADIGFCFEDLTEVDTPKARHLPLLNGRCVDTSKTHVAQVFETVSGRALAVDPTSWHDEMVAKSELNGAHDGRILIGPHAAEPGVSYQKLIDNLADDGCVEDLRCPTVGGQIDVVFLKRRPVNDRFANHNTEVRMLNPDEVFTPEERGLISEFCKQMGLDWGGLDVLRDRKTGEIWIVDVNKTDMGPPIALPLADKLTATRKLSQALRSLILKTLETDAEPAPGETI